MEVSILDNLVQTIISIYDEAYLIKGKNECYKVEGVDNKIQLKKGDFKDDLKDLFFNFDEDVLAKINSSDDCKTILKTKDGKDELLIIKKVEDYKCVFLVNLSINDVVKTNRKTILVADDSKMIINFMLKAVGEKYNVLVAKNGNEVVDIVNREKDNLGGIFLDLEMPSKNGYEVLEYFKDNDLFNSIPVAIISGEDSKDGIEKSAAYDIVDILQKPFSIDDARAFVDKVVNFNNQKD